MTSRSVFRSKRQWGAVVIGLAVSAIFLYVALGGLHLSEVWRDMRGVHLGWLGAGVVVYFFAVWGRTWRWHYLLRSIKPVSLGRLFPIVVIGYMGNNVYPLRAGEVIRAYVLRRDEQVSMSASLGTIIVERVFDGLVMLIFVFVALPFADFSERWLRDVVFFSTLLFWGAFLLFVFMALRPAQMRRLYTAVFDRVLPARPSSKAKDLAEQFMRGLDNLSRPRDLLMTLVSSIFIWLTETTKYWFVMHAFDFQVSFFVLMVMTAVVNLATTLPSSPGYIGTFDLPGIKTLTAYGVPQTVAASYTLVLHAALWLPITLLGFFFLYRKGLGWRDFARARQAIEGTGPATAPPPVEREGTA